MYVTAEEAAEMLGISTGYAYLTFTVIQQKSLKCFQIKALQTFPCVMLFFPIPSL